MINIFWKNKDNDKNNMNAWMKEISKRITRNGTRIRAISTVMFMTCVFSAMNVSITHTLNKVVHRCKTMGNTHKVRCMQKEAPKNGDSGHDVKANHLIKEPLPDRNTKSRQRQAEKLVDKARSQIHLKYDDEFRIILLGATGSGKSYVGNVLMQTTETNEGFETSCYAKSKTKQSIRKSVYKTIKRNDDSKMCKIDIIDTPAISDTGLNDKDVEQEIDNAKQLASPGPHAFLLCIPATAVTDYFTDDFDHYKRYFPDRLYDSTIIVFTKCDQFEKENNHAFDSESVIQQNSILKKMKNHIALEKDNSRKLEDIINIIIEMKKKKKHGVGEFATGF